MSLSGARGDVARGEIVLNEIGNQPQKAVLLWVKE